MHIPLPTSCCFPLPFTIRNPIKRKKPEKSFTFLGLQDKPVPEPLVTPPCTRDILANRTAASAARPAQSRTAAVSRESRPKEEENTEPARVRDEGSIAGSGSKLGLGLSRRGGVCRRRTEARSVRSTTAVGSRIAGSRSSSKSKFTEHIDAPRDGDAADVEEMHPYLRPQEYGVVDRSCREGCADRGDGEGREGRQNRRGGVVEGYLHDWRVWWEELCGGLKGS